MHGHGGRITFRLISERLFKSNSPKHGGRRRVDKLESSRTLTSSRGYECMEYGADATMKPMTMQIMDALSLGERGRASNLLLEFGHGKYSLSADDFVDIFKFCARSPEPLFVMEAWKIMEAREINLNSTCISLMMQALCKGGYLDEAYNLINFLRENHRIHPVLPLYNIFLKGCAKMQNMVYANQCLDLMENQMVGKNEITYTELLKLAVWQQNLSAIHQIWKDYIKHYSMSIISLRKFIWSFTRLGDLKSAYEALQWMVSLAVKGNSFVYRTAMGKLYSSRLDIPVPSNSELGSTMLELEENEESLCSICCEKVDHDSNSIEQQTISPIINEDGKNNEISFPIGHNNTSVMKVLKWSFSDVIHACAQSQECGMAEQLLLQMQNLGLKPSSHTYDGVVRAVVSERGFNDGMELLKIMHQKNLKPYDSTLATLSASCSRALELDLAEYLLNQISECAHLHPFNSFLAACDIKDQPERALRGLSKMKKLKILPDIRTYELLFSLFGNVNAPYEEGNLLSQSDAAKRINAIEMDMAKNGFQHSHLSMKNLLIALGAEGMIGDLIHYLNLAESLFTHSNTYMGAPIYNTVLHALVEAKRSHMAIEIFRNMKLCGCQVNSATYNIMIDCCSILRCFKSACVLVSMMIRDGFLPETLTYTALIKILLDDDNFEEALKLLDQTILELNQLDVLLFNTILRAACKKGRIDVIEYIVECMHQENVRPDSATCNHVFTAYVDCGFHNTAIEALQVLSMRMIGGEDSSLEEKENYENELVLAEEMEAESQILKLLFRSSQEHLAVALFNLRWCAMAGFPISWTSDQSPWAKRLSSYYSNRRAAL